MKCFLCVMVILLATLGVSCIKQASLSPSNPDSQGESSTSLFIEDQSKLDSVLNRINNVSPYNQLIKKKINIHTFIEKYANDPQRIFDGESLLITTIQNDFSIECLRKTEAGALYSVHKVKQGGLLYIFYRTKSYENTGRYTEVKNWFYVLKKLKYADFSSITEGSPMEDVAAIDPSTHVFMERANKQVDLYGLKTFHYLEDGIFILFYTYKNGKYEVNGQNYQPDFQVRTYWEAREELYDGRVFSQDLLK